MLPVNGWANDSLAASVFTVPAIPSPTSADGSDLGTHAVPSEFPPSLYDDSATLPSLVATPVSSAVLVDKAALGTIPAAPLLTSADGLDLGLHVVSSQFPPSLHDDREPLPSPVATFASSTVIVNKAALGAIPDAPFPISADGSDTVLNPVSSEFPPSLLDDVHRSLVRQRPFPHPLSSLTKSVGLYLSCSPCPQRLSRAPKGFRSSAAPCCVSFSLTCRWEQPCTSSG